MLLTLLLVLSLLANAVAAPLPVHGGSAAAEPRAEAMSPCGHAMPESARTDAAAAGHDAGCCSQIDCSCGCAAPSSLVPVPMPPLPPLPQAAATRFAPVAGALIQASPPLRPPAA